MHSYVRLVCNFVEHTNTNVTGNLINLIMKRAEIFQTLHAHVFLYPYKKKVKLIFTVCLLC